MPAITKLRLWMVGVFLDRGFQLYLNLLEAWLWFFPALQQ
jgi:uncharacterized membrane protein YqaE (UPF0057 family)